MGKRVQDLTAATAATLDTTADLAYVHDVSAGSSGDRKVVLRQLGVALAAQVSAATWTDLGTLDMTGIASGTPVRVGGKTTPGDGGHGEFYYDSASSAAPLTGMVYTPAVGSGRILRKYSGMIDVRWFNAAADGATDDTTAIQAAISFAESPTYGWAATAGTQVGTVFLPDGTYIVTNLQVKKGIILQGAGIWNTVLKGKTGTTGWLLTFDGSSGSSQINTEGNQVASAVRDIRFDGNNRMANYGCIQLTKMDHLQLENLFIWRFTRAAINCNKSVRESTFRTVKVRFCGNFDATDNNGAGWPAVSVVDQESLLGSAEDTHNGITFNDVQIVYSMGNALEIDTKQIHSGRKVTNVQFHHCWIHGWNSGFTTAEFFSTINGSATMQQFTLAKIAACYDVRFTNCRFSFTGKGKAAIWLTRSTLGGSAVTNKTYDPEMIQINNLEVNGSWDSVTAGRYGVQADYGSGVINNVIIDPSLQGPVAFGSNYRDLAEPSRIDDGLIFDGGISSTNAVATCQSLTTSDFTVRVRVRLPATVPATSAGIWTLGSAAGSISTPGIGLIFNSTGTLSVITYGASGSDTRTANVQFEWFQNLMGRVVDLVVVRDASGSTLSIYMNGGLLPSTEATGGAAPAWSQSITTTSFSLGVFITTNMWPSTLLAAQVFNRKLTAAEIQTLALRGVAISDRWGSTTVLSSGNLTVGRRYRITARASSDFTTVGAANNSVGTEFVATGTGAGLLTGTDTVVQIGAIIDLDLRNVRGGLAFDRSSNQLTCTLSANGVGASVIDGGVLYASATWDPANLAAGANTTTTVTVTGAAVGDLVTVSLSTLTTQAMVLTGAVSAANTVTVLLYNPTAGAIDLASGTLRVRVEKRQ